MVPQNGMKINNTTERRPPRILLLAGAVSLLSACGSIGDVSDVKAANELAIACKTGEALTALIARRRAAVWEPASLNCNEW